MRSESRASLTQRASPPSRCQGFAEFSRLDRCRVSVAHLRGPSASSTHEQVGGCLLYHHVGPVREPACRGLTVTAEAFRRQMGALAAMGYSTLLPDQWVSYVNGADDDCPERCVMLTFDDAYSDLIANAFPVLAKHGFSATVFVPTALAGKTIQCNPDNPDAFLPLMSPAEIAEWSAKGISFGAHSRTHVDLTRIPEADIRGEVAGSGDDLADLVRRPVSCFAYPYGHSSEVARAVVMQRFTSAFGIEEGLNDRSTPLHDLRRTMVQHRDTVVDVCLRAKFGKSIFDKVRSAASDRLPRTAT
jgi:Predicted xylanase/chitin deacetylase